MRADNTPQKQIASRIWSKLSQRTISKFHRVCVRASELALNLLTRVRQTLVTTYGASMLFLLGGILATAVMSLLIMSFYALESAREATRITTQLMTRRTEERIFNFLAIANVSAEAQQYMIYSRADAKLISDEPHFAEDWSSLLSARNNASSSNVSNGGSNGYYYNNINTNASSPIIETAMPSSDFAADACGCESNGGRCHGMRTEETIFFNESDYVHNVMAEHSKFVKYSLCLGLAPLSRLAVRFAGIGFEDGSMIGLSQFNPTSDVYSLTMIDGSYTRDPSAIKGSFVHFASRSNGSVFGARFIPNVAYDPRESPWFMEGNRISKPFQKAWSDVSLAALYPAYPIVSVIFSVFNRSNVRLGTGVVTLDLTALRRLVTLNRPTGNAHVAIINDKNFVVASSLRETLFVTVVPANKTLTTEETLRGCLFQKLEPPSQYTIHPPTHKNMLCFNDIYSLGHRPLTSMFERGLLTVPMSSDMPVSASYTDADEGIFSNGGDDEANGNPSSYGRGFVEQEFDRVASVSQGVVSPRKLIVINVDGKLEDPSAASSSSLLPSLSPAKSRLWVSVTDLNMSFPHLGWRLVVMIPEADALEEMRKGGPLFMGIFAATCLVLVVCFMLVARLFVLPLVDIVNKLESAEYLRDDDDDEDEYDEEGDEDDDENEEGDEEEGVSEFSPTAGQSERGEANSSHHSNASPSAFSTSTNEGDGGGRWKSGKYKMGSFFSRLFAVFNNGFSSRRNQSLMKKGDGGGGDNKSGKKMAGGASPCDGRVTTVFDVDGDRVVSGHEEAIRLVRINRNQINITPNDTGCSNNHSKNTSGSRIRLSRCTSGMEGGEEADESEEMTDRAKGFDQEQTEEQSQKTGPSGANKKKSKKTSSSTQKVEKRPQPATRTLSYLSDVAAIQQAYWTMADELRLLRGYIPEHVCEQLLAAKGLQQGGVRYGMADSHKRGQEGSLNRGGGAFTASSLFPTSNLSSGDGAPPSRVQFRDSGNKPRPPTSDESVPEEEIEEDIREGRDANAALCGASFFVAIGDEQTDAATASFNNRVRDTATAAPRGGTEGATANQNRPSSTTQRRTTKEKRDVEPTAASVEEDVIYTRPRCPLTLPLVISSVPPPVVGPQISQVAPPLLHPNVACPIPVAVSAAIGMAVDDPLSGYQHNHRHTNNLASYQHQQQQHHNAGKDEMYHHLTSGGGGRPPAEVVTLPFPSSTHTIPNTQQQQHQSTKSTTVLPHSARQVLVVDDPFHYSHVVSQPFVNEDTNTHAHPQKGDEDEEDEEERHQRLMNEAALLHFYSAPSGAGVDVGPPIGVADLFTQAATQQLSALFDGREEGGGENEEEDEDERWQRLANEAAMGMLSGNSFANTRKAAVAGAGEVTGSAPSVNALTIVVPQQHDPQQHDRQQLSPASTSDSSSTPPPTTAAAAYAEGGAHREGTDSEGKRREEENAEKDVSTLSSASSSSSSSSSDVQAVPDHQPHVICFKNNTNNSNANTTFLRASLSASPSFACSSGPMNDSSVNNSSAFYNVSDYEAMLMHIHDVCYPPLGATAAEKRSPAYQTHQQPANSSCYVSPSGISTDTREPDAENVPLNVLNRLRSQKPPVIVSSNTVNRSGGEALAFGSQPRHNLPRLLNNIGGLFSPSSIPSGGISVNSTSSPILVERNIAVVVINILGFHEYAERTASSASLVSAALTRATPRNEGNINTASPANLRGVDGEGRHMSTLPVSSAAEATAKLVKDHEVLVQFIHEAAKRCGGVLDTFSGDKFWVSFNATIPVPPSSQRYGRGENRGTSTTQTQTFSKSSTSLFFNKNNGEENEEGLNDQRRGAEGSPEVNRAAAETIAREVDSLRTAQLAATLFACEVCATINTDASRCQSIAQSQALCSNNNIDNSDAAADAGAFNDDGKQQDKNNKNSNLRRRIAKPPLAPRPPLFAVAPRGVTVGVATGKAFVGPMGTSKIRRHTIISSCIPQAAALERLAARYPDCGVMVGGDMIPAIEGYFQYLLVDAVALPGCGGKRRRIASVKGPMHSPGSSKFPSRLLPVAYRFGRPLPQYNPYRGANACLNAFLEGRAFDVVHLLQQMADHVALSKKRGAKSDLAMISKSPIDKETSPREQTEEEAFGTQKSSGLETHSSPSAPSPPPSQLLSEAEARLIMVVHDHIMRMAGSVDGRLYANPIGSLFL